MKIKKEEVVPGLSDSGQAKHSDEVDSRGIPELVWWTISGTFEIDAAEMKVPGWGFSKLPKNPLGSFIEL